MENLHRHTTTISSKNFFMVPHSLKDSLGAISWIVNDGPEVVSATVSRKDLRESSRKSEDKKIGAESSDPNRRSQPRLPGSVVGSASMPRTRFPYKITEVSVQK